MSHSNVYISKVNSSLRIDGSASVSAAKLAAFYHWKMIRAHLCPALSNLIYHAHTQLADCNTAVGDHTAAAQIDALSWESPSHRDLLLNTKQHFASPFKQCKLCVIQHANNLIAHHWLRIPNCVQAKLTLQILDRNVTKYRNKLHKIVALCQEGHQLLACNTFQN